MRIFWIIYGRTAVSLAVMALLSVGLMLFLGKGFGQYGTAPDKSAAVQERTVRNISNINYKPVLDVKSIRLIQGERRTVESMADAHDIDGMELDESVRFTDKNGHVIHGYFDTSTPGCFPVTVSVCSKITGERVQKNIYILVDGRVKAWKE